MAATGGRFCPGDECGLVIEDVEPDDRWSIVEVGNYWPALGRDHDTGGMHSIFKDESGVVEYDAIVLVRHQWTRRTVLHEIGHRLGLEHEDNVPIMRGPHPGQLNCLTLEDVQAACARIDCDGYEITATCE